MSATLTREEELAALIAEQEVDAEQGDRIRFARDVSLDKPLSDDVDATLADVVGAEDVALDELLGQNETWVAFMETSRSTDGDVEFWRYLRDVESWTYKAIAERVGVTAQTVTKRISALPKQRNTRSTRALRGHLDKKAKAAHTLYRTPDWTLRSLAEQLYEGCGYASVDSCYQALRKAFQRERLPIRTRAEANRLFHTKHGMRARSATPEQYRAYNKRQNDKARERRQASLRPCWAITRADTPCKRSAIGGMNFCVAHGPLGRRRKWTMDVVCDSLVAWADQNGRRPTPRDWKNATDDYPNFKTVYDLFGSWPAAMYAAFDAEQVAA